MRPLNKTRKALRELSQAANVPKIQHGVLAEDYDGIGQYVLVALAHSSVGSAYRARIAAGDFGTGQKIPLGTPVSVFSLHGQIEILSMGAK
jgi:hypothetical protein